MFLSVGSWYPQCSKKERSKWESEKRSRRRSTEKENEKAREEDTARRKARAPPTPPSRGGTKKPRGRAQLKVPKSQERDRREKARPRQAVRRKTQRGSQRDH